MKTPEAQITGPVSDSEEEGNYPMYWKVGETTIDEWHYASQGLWRRTITGPGRRASIAWGFDRTSKHEDPAFSFTCNMVAKNRSTQMADFLRIARNVVDSLRDHRFRHECDCDFSYAVCGRTDQDVIRLCKSMNHNLHDEILKAIQKHNEMCSCGCFDHTGGKKKVLVSLEDEEYVKVEDWK